MLEKKKTKEGVDFRNFDLLKNIKLLLYKYPLKKGCLPFKILNGKTFRFVSGRAYRFFFLDPSLKTDTFFKGDFGVLSL